MLERLSIGTKIVILVIIAVVIITAIVLTFVFIRKGAEEVGPAVIDETQPPPRQALPAQPTQQPIVLPELTDDEKDQEQLQNLARVFAERYGSFSNQAGFQNLVDIQSMLTDSMKQWVEKQRQDLMKKYPMDDKYYGVITSAPISKVQSFNQSSAVILVTTQRIEKQNGEEKVYEQDLKVEFIKQNGDWLVNGAYWQ